MELYEINGNNPIVSSPESNSSYAHIEFSVPVARHLYLIRVKDSYGNYGRDYRFQVAEAPSN
jgi:hypothetical protein